jgi:NOL1/NOP2/fmu family ribosome biogenesis protein
VKQPVTMLDACAAPGGKTTCAMSALPEGSVLFSNEPMRTRANILAENILKYGNPNIIVTNNYPRDYKKTKLQFDVILTDVPCSGEGMFRKDQGAIDEWSTKKVEECTELQRSIVQELWDNLRPGGLLVYSTCTFNAHEDEENVEWIVNELGAKLLEVPVKEEWNITGSLINNNKGKLGGNFPVYRFIPGKTKGEGLFMAVMRKNGSTNIPFRDTNAKLTAFEEKETKKLKVLAHGINADIIKGKNTIPDHSKALSILSPKDEYPKVEISWKDAINYLRKEAIVLPNDAPRGIVLLSYNGFALGFAKNLGNRANNLYPQEWRIKSTHVPTDPPASLVVAPTLPPSPGN